MIENKEVSMAEDGQRIDRWLKKHFPDIGFGQMQKMLRTGQVRIDGKRAKPDTKLAAGQTVRIPPQLGNPDVKPPVPKKISDEDAAFIQSLVLYKDDHIIALNKPSGMATQGGSKVKRHIDGLLEGLCFDGDKPKLVHRLDRDTSGVLLLARTVKAAALLGKMFQGRSVRKYYWAITMPAPEHDEATINAPIAKIEGRGGERMMIVDENHPEAKPAQTCYAVMERAGKKAAWVAFWPRTGRTHQIRVHAALMKAPLLGDYKYRESTDERDVIGVPDRLHLHARRIKLPHPVQQGKMLDITAPLPDDMRETWAYFGFDPEDTRDPFKEIK